MANLPRTYKKFMDKYPEIHKAYENLAASIAASGPLNTKTRELIKLGMAAGIGSESAVISHTRRALEAGAMEKEIQQSVLSGMTTIGFPKTMAAYSWAEKALGNHD
jgi:AhpD family alkylhydroperoxidase